jgi:hypothetical protein
MLDQLKKDFPGMSEEVLKQVADSEEGLQSQPDATEQDEEDDSTADAGDESTDNEEENEEQEDAESTPEEVEKKVPLKALHEERNKRKALSAQIEAMKSEIEAIKNRPAQQPVQQQPQQDISEWVEQQAEKEVRERLKVIEPLDELQWSDPEKYRKVNKEIAKAEFRIESEISNINKIKNENINFVKELQTIEDFPVVLKYAIAEIDEMPRKQAREIEDAYGRVDAGKGNAKDFQIVKDFALQCKEKLNGSKSTSPGVASPANKIAEMAKMPRASQLSGGNGSRSLSTSELESMLDQGRFEDVPPEVIKKYMR